MLDSPHMSLGVTYPSSNAETRHPVEIVHFHDFCFNITERVYVCSYLTFERIVFFEIPNLPDPIFKVPVSQSPVSR